MRFVAKLKIVLGSLFWLVSGTTQAFDLRITQQEFLQLSRNCQLYYYSVVGSKLDYNVPFSASEVAAARVEAEYIGGAWHYCGGLVWLNRAVLASDEHSQKYAYRQALAEIHFTARKTPVGNPMFTEIKVNHAKAMFLNEQKVQSKDLLNSLLAEFPNMTAARIELARQLRSEKQTKAAIEVLEKASPREFETSADLNYFLGVYHYHNGNLTAAKKYGDQAYKLNYPLPWLKQKLAQKGIR